MDETPITVLLDAARLGDREATEALFNAVYGELRVIARSNRRRWRGNRTLNTTALIHEVFIKLSGGDHLGFQNRTHFYATASKAMRQILVNYAQRQSAAKRGAAAVHVTFDESVFETEASADEVLTIHQLLTELEAENPRRSRVIECRIFGGMTIEEVADALGISTATVKREWRVGTAGLYRALQDDESEGDQVLDRG